MSKQQSQTWIAVALTTTFEKNDKAVVAFKEQKKELEIEVKSFIESWLSQRSIPYHVNDPVMSTTRNLVEDLRQERLTSATITENEKALLLAIRDSEYNDGLDKTSPVWVDCLWGFEGKTKFGGVMASLTKKGLANTDGECAWLTLDGLAVIEDEPYICTIDRAKEVK